MIKLAAVNRYRFRADFNKKGEMDRITIIDKRITLWFDN